MREGRNAELLDVVGLDVPSPAQERPRPRHAEERDGTARRCTERDQRRASSGGDDRQHVVGDLRRHDDDRDGGLEPPDVLRGSDRVQMRQLLLRPTSEEQLPLHLRRRIADGEAEQEPVEL